MDNNLIDQQAVLKDLNLPKNGANDKKIFAQYASGFKNPNIDKELNESIDTHQ